MCKKRTEESDDSTVLYFGAAYRTTVLHGINLRFAQTWADWLRQPATGGDGGDRRPLRVLIACRPNA